MTYQLSHISTASSIAYDDFLKVHFPLASFYASSLYGRVLEQHLNTKWHALIIKQKKDIVAAFPYMICENHKWGNILNSLPFYGSHGGFLIKKKLDFSEQKEITALLNKHLLETTKNLSLSAYTIIENLDHQQSDLDLSLIIEHHFQDHRLGQVTILPPSSSSLEEELRQTYHPVRSRNMRKATQSGIKVRLSQHIDDFKFLHETHKKNITDVKGLAKKWDFFNLITTELKNNYQLYIADYNNAPIAALLLFTFSDTIEYFTPAIKSEHRDLQASSLLIFEAMKKACQQGFKYWNWGGTWPSQQGVYDFKKKWGAQDYSYRYFTKIINRDLLAASKEDLMKAYPYFYVLPFDELQK